MLASDVIQNVQDLGYGADTATQQLRFLNACYRAVNGLRRWPWTTATTTIATTTGSTSISLASITDLVAIDSVHIKSASSGPVDLDYVDPNTYDQWTQFTTPAETGTPEFWTHVNGAISVYPAPDGTWTQWVIDYKKTIPDLVLGGTPVWPSDFHDILTFGTAALMAARERDWDAKAAFDQQFQNKIRDMLNQVGLPQRQSAQHMDMTYWNRMRST